MQFPPKTENQLIAEGLMPAGEYDFRIITAVEGVSKSSGKPMITLELEVFDTDGKGRKVRDYLMESMGFKLRHFAFATGLGSNYEAGKMDAADMVERTGRLELKIEPEKNGYAARNGVKDYVVPEAKEDPAPTPAKATRPAAYVDPANDPSAPPF